MKVLQIIMFVLCTSLTFGQSHKKDTPYIEITGKAELEISPNEIYIDLLLKEKVKNGEKTSLETLENSLKSELVKIGVPKENLFISDINSVISKTGWWTKEVLSTGKYSLKVTSPEKLKKVFEVFEKLKITDTNITKATHSELTAFKRKNRIAAIKAAKEKAGYLLKAINASTGKPLRVYETEHQLEDFAQINHLNVSNNYSISKVKPYRNDVVQFENIKLISSIHVVFEIK